MEKLKTNKNSFVCYVLLFCMFRAVLNACLCMGRFAMVPLNLTCLYCLQHNFFEHLFNFYYDCHVTICQTKNKARRTSYL